MNRNRTITTTLLIVATLFAVPFVYGGPGGHGRGHDGGFMLFALLGKAKEELNLTDQQVEQIKGIAQSLREQNEPYREQLRGGLGDVARALIADPNNVAAAQAILDQQSAAEKAMKSNVLNATARALSVLTSEQRQRLADKLAERKGRRRSR